MKGGYYKVECLKVEYLDTEWCV